MLPRLAISVELGSATLTALAHLVAGDPATQHKLDVILHNQEKIMATLSTFQQLLTAVNDVTNQIAANVQKLLDKITAGGMSATEEDQVAVDLQKQIDALKAVAASSTDPVPPPPPVTP